MRSAKQIDEQRLLVTVHTTLNVPVRTAAHNKIACRGAENITCVVMRA